MNEHKIKEAQALLADKPSLRTKSQKLRHAILTGKVKYLHVSVQVKAPEPLRNIPAMRTPRGQGSTARRDPRPNQGPIGRRRRANQRLMRAAREELALASLRV